MNRKRKSKSIKAAWISAGAVIIAAIIYGIFSLWDTSESKRVINNEIVATDSSNVKVTNNQNKVHGDFISAEKVEIKKVDDSKTDNSVIEAPNALIVTKDQSGGNNTVNINQVSFQSYQKPTQELIYSMSQNLDNLKSKYTNAPKVKIEIESGNSIRHKVALDLEQFLIAKNMGYYPKRNTSTGRFPDFPISIFSSSANLNFAVDFINSLEPYIDSYFYIDTTSRSNEIVTMYINGTPSFKNNGSVKIE